jgi:hypothetical protein
MGSVLRRVGGSLRRVPRRPEIPRHDDDTLSSVALQPSCDVHSLADGQPLSHISEAAQCHDRVTLTHISPLGGGHQKDLAATSCGAPNRASSDESHEVYGVETHATTVARLEADRSC